MLVKALYLDGNLLYPWLNPHIVGALMFIYYGKELK